MRKGIGEDGKVVAVIGDGALTGGVAYEALHNAGGLADADRDRPERQRDVDLAQRRRPLALLPARPPEPAPLPRARGRRGAASPSCRSASAARSSASAPRSSRRSRPTRRPACCSRSSTSPTWASSTATTSRALRRALARGARGRPAGGRPHPHGQGQGLRARPRRAASRAWRSGTRRSPGRSSTANRRRRRRAGQGDRLAGADREARDAAAAAPPQYTAVFADALVAEAKRDRRVIGITAAMAGGTGLDKLGKEVPEQYYDVGIAEQDAVLFAAGLALQGAKPVCAIYSTFLQRGFDQIVHDVCLQKLNVVFAMDRAGLVGDDGPTHHGAFDISYLRPPAEHGR